MTARATARAEPASILKPHGAHTSMRAYARESIFAHAPRAHENLARVYAPVRPVRPVRFAGCGRAVTCAVTHNPVRSCVLSSRLEKKMDEEARKARVREAFPVCTGVADAFRSAFGDGVQIRYAEEGEKRIGRTLDESKFKVIAGSDMILQKPQKGERRGR